MGFIKFSRNLFGGGKRKNTATQNTGSQNVEPNVSQQNQNQNACQHDCAPAQSTTSRDSVPFGRSSKEGTNSSSMPFQRVPSNTSNRTVSGAGVRTPDSFVAQPQHHHMPSQGMEDRAEEYDEIPFDVPIQNAVSDDFDAMDIPMDMAPTNLQRQHEVATPSVAPHHATVKSEQSYQHQKPQQPRQALAPILGAPVASNEALKPPKTAAKSQTFSYGGGHHATSASSNNNNNNNNNSSNREQPNQLRRMQSMPAPKLPSQEISSTVVCALGEIDALSPMVAEVRKKIAERVCSGDSIFMSRRNESWPNSITPFKSSKQGCSAAEESSSNKNVAHHQSTAKASSSSSNVTVPNQQLQQLKPASKASWQTPQNKQSFAPVNTPSSTSKPPPAFKIPDLQVLALSLILPLRPLFALFLS
jgi:hypothetical protein